MSRFKCLAKTHLVTALCTAPAPADRRGGVPDRGALLDVGGVAAQAVAGRAVADSALCRRRGEGEVGRGQRERLLEPPAQLQVLAVRPRQARLQWRRRRDRGHHGGLRGRQRRRFAPRLLLSLFGVMRNAIPDRFFISKMYLWVVCREYLVY